MKKILLLSLLFSALVFQSCKKLSSETGEGLPIMFSQAGITKTIAPAESLVDALVGDLPALVLGSLTSNNWTNIYRSAKTDDGNLANRKIVLGPLQGATNAFSPPVLYPLSPEYVYIKALAPFDAIESGIEGISSVDKVIFTINGNNDIMATRLTTLVENQDASAEDFKAYHGCGNRNNMEVKLTFDHLLSKIDFYVHAENAKANEYWGKFVSVTFLNGHTKLVYNLADHKISLPEAPAVQNLTVPVEGGGMEMPLTSEVTGQIPTTSGYACSALVFPSFTDCVPPKDATLENWTVQVTTEKLIGGATEVTQIAHDVPPFNKTLVKGVQYRVELKFTENKEIGFNVTTESWGTPTTNPDGAEIY